jgi:hypothetical protein
MIYTIYKIVCDDANVDFSYVGSTRSFRHRKAQHKSNCNNEKDNGYNRKLYTTIRENGGWNNFRMVIIAEIEVESKRQAEIIEEEHRLKLQANLNSQRCYITEEQKKERDKQQVKQHGNTKCNCECGCIYTNWNKSQHLKTDKHKKYLEQIKDI